MKERTFAIVVKVMAILVIFMTTLYLSSAFGGLAVAWCRKYPGFEAWIMVPSCLLLLGYTWYFLFYRGSRRVWRSNII